MLLSMLVRPVHWLGSRAEGPYIYRLDSYISMSIFVSISIPVCISVCTDMSRSAEAYPHTPTAYQTDLRLTLQVHMQHNNRRSSVSDTVWCSPQSVRNKYMWASWSLHRKIWNPLAAVMGRIPVRLLWRSRAGTTWTSYTICSSPVTEDVPPRRDRSSHGLPPSVTGLVQSWSIPLHPTSVTGLVHLRCKHTMC